MGSRDPHRQANLLFIVCAVIILFGLTVHAFADWAGQSRGPVSLISCGSGNNGGLAAAERSGSCALHAGFVVPALSAILSLLTLLLIESSTRPGPRRRLLPPLAHPPITLPTA